MDLDDKVAVVTGGSNGIGAATVRALAAEGAHCVVCYNNGAARAEALIATLPGQGHRAMRLVLEDAGTIAACVAAVREAFGRADILVNCAGFTRPVPHADLDALSDDLIDAVLIANVRGPFSVIRAFVPLLRASGDGVIVNVSSVAAFTGAGSNIAYGAAKAGVDTMTMSLARVLGPEIRVNCVSPGAVPTGFVAGRSREQVQTMAAQAPLRRVTEPEDVARAVLACVTHLRMTTGTRIVVDGGRHL